MVDAQSTADLGALQIPRRYIVFISDQNVPLRMQSDGRYSQKRNDKSLIAMALLKLLRSVGNLQRPVRTCSSTPICPSMCRILTILSHNDTAWR